MANIRFSKQYIEVVTFDLVAKIIIFAILFTLGSFFAGYFNFEPWSFVAWIPSVLVLFHSSRTRFYPIENRIEEITTFGPWKKVKTRTLDDVSHIEIHCTFTQGRGLMPGTWSFAAKVAYVDPKRDAQSIFTATETKHIVPIMKLIGALIDRQVRIADVFEGELDLTPLPEGLQRGDLQDGTLKEIPVEAIRNDKRFKRNVVA